jgi:hypothetical protein
MANNTIKGKASTREVWYGPRLLDPKPSQKVWNHSPDGFNWGYGGSGPAQLALAILLRLAPETIAVRHHQKFKEDHIATLPSGEDFEMSLDSVRTWLYAAEIDFNRREEAYDETTPRDPIHEKDGKWYFWTETWADEYGPYDTREIAEKELARYVESI